MVGLQYLFLEPNPDDPLNKGTYPILSVNYPSSQAAPDAALEMTKNREQFINNVKQTMRGGYLRGTTYDNVQAPR